MYASRENSTFYFQKFLLFYPLQQTMPIQTNKLLEQIPTAYHRTTTTVFRVCKVLYIVINGHYYT